MPVIYCGAGATIGIHLDAFVVRVVKNDVSPLEECIKTRAHHAHAVILRTPTLEVVNPHVLHEE